MRKENLTPEERELLQSLCEGCNIALYRSGKARLRDSTHSPVKNIRLDLFEKIRNRLIQIDGLFYIKESEKQTLHLN